MDESQYSLFGSITSLGAMAGCVLGSFASDIFGRQKGILFGSPLYVLSGILIAAGNSASILIWARLLMGIAVGMLLTNTTVYLSEMSPPRLRGAFGSFSQV